MHVKLQGKVADRQGVIVLSPSPVIFAGQGIESWEPSTRSSQGWALLLILYCKTLIAFVFFLSVLGWHIPGISRAPTWEPPPAATAEPFGPFFAFFFFPACSKVTPSSRHTKPKMKLSHNNFKIFSPTIRKKSKYGSSKLESGSKSSKNWVEIFSYQNHFKILYTISYRYQVRSTR